MARNFVLASAQYLEYGAAIGSAMPLTMACWARPGSSADTRTALSLHTNGSNNHRLSVRISTTHVPEAVIRETGPTRTAPAASAMTPGTWGHIAGVFASTTSYTGYFNGVAGTTGTTATNPSGWNRWAVGRLNTAAPDNWDGDLAEAAIWNVALATADIAQLAAGYSPVLVRPDALLFYAPLVGRMSPEIDLIAGQDLTLTNTPVVATHPRVLMPNPAAAQWWGFADRRFPWLIPSGARNLPLMY
jgi:hypothetical protein